MENIINTFSPEKIKTGDSGLAYGLASVSAAVAVLGSSIASVAQGIGVAKAVEAIGRNPEAMSKIRSVMIIVLAIVETGSIYCFIIALLLIFV